MKWTVLSLSVARSPMAKETTPYSGWLRRYARLVRVSRARSLTPAQNLANGDEQKIFVTKIASALAAHRIRQRAHDAAGDDLGSSATVEVMALARPSLMIDIEVMARMA